MLGHLFTTKLEQQLYITFISDIQLPVNGTYKLSETVPDYFNGVVLQRHHISENGYGTIKFQLAFNLAVVWMIVFVSLSKGLRSYGKVVFAFTLLPIIGIFILYSKFMANLPEYVKIMFPENTWSEFFMNPKVRNILILRLYTCLVLTMYFLNNNKVANVTFLNRTIFIFYKKVKSLRVDYKLYCSEKNSNVGMDENVILQSFLICQANFMK